MAYGKLLDYKPINIQGTPAYEFTRTDGPPVLMYGDEAEDLRSRLDASKAAGPQPTAEATGGMSVDPMTGGMSLAPAQPVRVDVPVEVPGAGGAGPDMGAGGSGPGPDMGAGGAPADYTPPPPAATQEAAEEKPQSEGQPQVQPRHVAGNLMDVGGVLMERKVDPGVREVTRKELQQDVAQQVETPTKTQTTVEGAVPRDPEIEAGYLEARAWQRDKLEEAREIAVQNAFNEKEIRRAEVQRSTAAVRAQQEAVELQQAKLQEYEQVRNRARAEYKAGRVDPSRLFKGEGGTLRALGAAIAAGAGAFGATLGRTQNYAQQAIEASIDRDIRSQEEEIRVKGDAADNAMKDFMAQGLTVEQSRLLLTELMRDHVKANAELMASEGLIDRTDITYQQMLAQHDIRTLEIQKQWQREATGNATRTVAAEMRSPVKGRPGGVSYEPASLEKTKAAIDIEKAKRELAGGGVEERPVETSTMERFSEYGRAYQAFNRINKNPLLGDKQGRFLDVTSGTGRALTMETPAYFGGREAQNFDQDLAVGLQANRKAVTGAGASVEELGRLRTDWVGQGSQREIARKSKIGMDESVQGMRNILHGLKGPERNRMMQSIRDPELRARILEE